MFSSLLRDPIAHCGRSPLCNSCAKLVINQENLLNIYIMYFTSKWHHFSVCFQSMLFSRNEMSYPVFSGSPFATNTNQLPFNLNQNVNIPPPVSAFQQNANMSFLSFPPPTLPGSHHVFQNGPRFPGMNSAPPFAANIGNPNGMSPPRFPASTPGSVNLRPPANPISPARFTANPAITAMTSMPPPSISPWNPAPNPRNFPENFQQLQNNQQGSNALNMNPWAAAPSNNFQSSANYNHPSPSQVDVKPWGADPSKLLTDLSKSPVCNINPWAQPPPNLAGTSYSNNYQFSNGGERPNHQNFQGKNQQNFNHRRGNSRNFPNGNRHGNHQWQVRQFKIFLIVKCKRCS